MKNQERLDRERSLNLASEIAKLTSKRRLQGDKQVFKDVGEYKKACLQVLSRYNVLDSEKKAFLESVDKFPFHR